MNVMARQEAMGGRADLDRLRQSWIDGKPWTDADGAIDHCNPYDGSAIGSIETVGDDAVSAAVAAARRSYETSWGILPPTDHKRLLAAFADAIAAHAETLAQLETVEVGRPTADALRFVTRAPDMLRSYSALGDHIRGDLFAAEDHRIGMTWRRSRGVVAAITPWNVPVMNVIIRAAPALAAGNCIVIKPSEHSARSAVLLARIATDAGLPDGVFNVVLGDGVGAGRALAAHPGIDLLTFTGSTQTGLAISRAAATATLKPLLLECGGKSAQIMLDDAFSDPDIWPHIFFSAFWNSGQWCAGKTRLLVPRARINDALDGLKRAAARWRVGDPRDPDTMLGPLANAGQLFRVNCFFAMARTQGDLIDLGCPRGDLPASGCFAFPSVALGAAIDSPIVQEEIFGPLLSLEPFDDLDEAIARANATCYGLHAAVWTNDATAGQRLARGIVAGSITVHATAQAATWPFSDFASMRYFEPQRQSGIGMDGGLQGLLAYTTAQSISFLS